MATISKFYLLDAATPNTGTMPTGAFDTNHDFEGDATGARTPRDATDVKGTSNPDVKSLITANADINPQHWGHRRFVSRPLAAQTISAGTWTFSYARQESNLNHNASFRCDITVWRPTSSSIIVQLVEIVGTEPTSAGAEQAESVTGSAGSQVILDGDVLVFEISDVFQQGMSTAYTSQFSYDGTTEASTTTCASFVTPPAALTLFTPVQPVLPLPHPALIYLRQNR